MNFNKYRTMSLPQLAEEKRQLEAKRDRIWLIEEEISKGGRNRPLSESESDRCDEYDRHIETIDAYLRAEEFRSMPLSNLFLMALRQNIVVDELREREGYDSPSALQELHRFWGMTVIIGRLLNNHEVQIDVLCQVSEKLHKSNKLGGTDFDTCLMMYIAELKLRGFKPDFGKTYRIAD